MQAINDCVARKIATAVSLLLVGLLFATSTVKADEVRTSFRDIVQDPPFKYVATVSIVNRSGEMLVLDESQTSVKGHRNSGRFSYLAWHRPGNVFSGWSRTVTGHAMGEINMELRFKCETVDERWVTIRASVEELPQFRGILSERNVVANTSGFKVVVTKPHFRDNTDFGILTKYVDATVIISPNAHRPHSSA